MVANVKARVYTRLTCVTNILRMHRVPLFHEETCVTRGDLRSLTTISRGEDPQRTSMQNTAQKTAAEEGPAHAAAQPAPT